MESQIVSHLPRNRSNGHHGNFGQRLATVALEHKTLQIGVLQNLLYLLVLAEWFVLPEWFVLAHAFGVLAAARLYISVNSKCGSDQAGSSFNYQTSLFKSQIKSKKKRSKSKNVKR